MTEIKTNIKKKKKKKRRIRHFRRRVYLFVKCRPSAASTSCFGGYRNLPFVLHVDLNPFVYHVPGAGSRFSEAVDSKCPGRGAV